MGVFPAGSKKHLPLTWQTLMFDPVSITYTMVDIKQITIKTFYTNSTFINTEEKVKETMTKWQSKDENVNIPIKMPYAVLLHNPTHSFSSFKMQEKKFKHCFSPKNTFRILY